MDGILSYITGKPKKKVKAMTIGVDVLKPSHTTSELSTHYKEEISSVSV
jgi:hypothetical protein